MTMNMILIMIFFMNLIFIFMFHPLAMIFVLIVQCMLISLMVHSVTHFPWFSYTLILVFLGGMLILFMYMSNIASNEMFKPNIKMLIPLVVIPMIAFFITSPKQDYSLESKIMEQHQFTNFMIFKPFSLSIMPVTMLMASYIILTLLTVVKISKMSQGPLRVV
uniref:NADH dehydrogenase subunit 6 n=1 Tax=Chthamalus malayensis TaxID=316610 RepID=A0A7T6ZUW0_CHTMA|nr:NADH dehydrogenase subunit 6 [Chthamalus malayensis]QQK92488.1 NADH dehydrogenase subunit 6 [Chthamalus malayensis]